MPDANVTQWITGLVNLGFAVWVAVFLLTKFSRTLDDNLRSNKELLDVVRAERNDTRETMAHQSALLEKVAASSEVNAALLRELLSRPARSWARKDEPE